MTEALDRTRPEEDRLRKVVRWLGLLLVVGVMFGVRVEAEQHSSPTIDEPGHLVRGLAYWWTDERGIHWPHPPLGQAVATAPVAFMAREHAARLRHHSKDFRHWAYHYFGSANYAVARRELQWARWTMAALAALFSLVVFAWTRRRFDEPTAWFSTLFYAANPIVLAHGGLMTNDFPIAAVSFLALMAVDAHLRSKRAFTLVPVALAVAALAVTKISGLLVAAILAPPVAIVALLGKGPYRKQAVPLRLVRLLGEGLFVVAVTVFVINFTYSFEETNLTVQEAIDHPTVGDRFKDVEVLGEERPIGRLPRDMRIPLPWTYLYSLDFIAAQNEDAHGGWFDEEETEEGVPGYFLVMLGAKMPTAILVLLSVGPFVWLRKEKGRGTAVLLAYVVVAFLLATYDARINIGVRHVIVVVPLLAVLAGLVAGHLWGKARLTRRSRWPHWLARSLAVGTAAATLVGAGLAHPRYIGDFNWLVGGRRGGHRISMVGEDWGQDMMALARYAHQHRVGTLHYVRTSRLRARELRHLGVRVRTVGCARRQLGADRTVAIHATTYLRRESCRRALSARDAPIVLNDHIYVYPAEPRSP